MLTLSLERNGREAGTIRKIVDLQENLLLKSFPVGSWERLSPGTIYRRTSAGFNCSHPRNRSRSGTGKPGTICGVRRRRNGPFLAIFQYGGRERGIAPPSDQKTRFARFAGSHPRQVRIGLGGNR